MLTRNNAIVLLLMALWVGTWAVQTDRVQLPWVESNTATEATIVWSLSGPPVPTHLQAELRDMGSETLTVGMLEESAEATDPEENAAMQAVIKAGRDAGLPAFVRSRGVDIVQAVGNISEKKTLKELIE